jgi:hypothetical protein
MTKGKVIFFLGLIAAGFAAVPAHATTVTYDLTLTPFCCGGGPESGTGNFTIVLPPDTPMNNSGKLTLANGGLVSLNIFIDGQHLTANGSAEIDYNYNSLSLSSFQIDNITYSGTAGNAEITSLSTVSYSFTDTQNGANDTNGSLTFQVAPTPLPAALPLFAAGLGALGLLGWRRKRTARSVAV